MPSIEIIDEQRVRAISREEAARPELVTQRSVYSVTSMPARDYLAHIRAGDWPSYADRRLRYSRTLDVISYLEAHPVKPRVVANDVESAAFSRSRSGIRRVGA